MTAQNLLIELFVEELPPKALKKLGEAFASVLFDALKAQSLASDACSVTNFATPRRLAAHITAVASMAADKQVAQKLMPASVGLDAAGNATPALIKRLQALGADETAVKLLRKENDGKADVLFFDAIQTGAKLQDGLQKALDEAIAKLPIPKVMTYQLADGWSSVNFVRPAHSLVALHGSDIVPITALGLMANNVTFGHRFEAKIQKIELNHADSYEQQLKTEGAVIASFDARKAEIVRQLNGFEMAKNLKVIDDDALLDEVTALVERPNVLLGEFEKEFLEVPQECLILTMKANQKYFPLLDASGKLTNQFLIVSNISPKDPSFVIGGNERVVRPRLADAKFFFDQDRKKTLESRLEGLNKVVYHNKLGSQGERNKRVREIAKGIAAIFGDELLCKNVDIAARLSKADLLTDMVGEFPELQGIMGRYYALHQGLDNDVAFAIEDHYMPKSADDGLPRNKTGLVVALADKLETLVGLFSIGEKPTGDKDPFGLRRQALGIYKLLCELGAACIFKNILMTAANSFTNNLNESLIVELKRFIFERISNNHLGNFSPQEIDAVLSLDPDCLSNVPDLLDAVHNFAKLSEAPALAAANKRVGNILKKVEGEINAQVKADLLQEPAEIALSLALSMVKPLADQLFEVGDYTKSLQTLAALKTPVDDFFDHVMVNADDLALKNNRLALLKQLHDTMNRVADLSKLAS